MDERTIAALAKTGFEAWAEEMSYSLGWEEIAPENRAAWIAATRAITEEAMTAAA